MLKRDEACAAVDDKSSKLQYCQVCNAERKFIERYDSLIFEGRSYSVFFCSECFLGVTTPFPVEDAMKKLYSSDAYRNDTGKKFVGFVEILVGFFASLRCARIDKFVSRGRVLDVGCGRGDFLVSMKNRGWHVSGVEMDERRSRYARETLGIDVTNEEVSNAGYENNFFDVITVIHVLEHLRAPREFLNESTRVLRPGGLLVMAVPNTASLQARLTGDSWLHLDVPYHLYHFSFSNLSQLLVSVGFEVRQVRYFTFDQNVFGFLQSIQNAIGFKRNMLFDLLRSKNRGSEILKNGGVKRSAGVLLMFLTLPFLSIIALILSVGEAIFGMGGTIEIYATKKTQ